MIDECDDDVCGMGLLQAASCFGEYGNSPRAETALVCLLPACPFCRKPPSLFICSQLHKWPLFSTMRPEEGWERLDAKHLKNAALEFCI